MHILQETPVGYALFKDMPLELVELFRYTDIKNATESVIGIPEGVLPSSLLPLFSQNISTLTLSNAKLAEVLQKEAENKNMKIKICTSEDKDREIQSRLPELLSIEEKELDRYSLILAHSLCREKLKMTPQKNDAVIVQSIRVISRLDKDINNKCMRIREWYGMHCPELGELIEDNQKYIETVAVHLARILPTKESDTTDAEMELPKELSAIQGITLSAEVESALSTTLSSESTPEDAHLILSSALQLLSMFSSRESLHAHLLNRLSTVAPNLLELLGPQIAALLISAAGSLSDLARLPASSVQLLGAEKALFKSLKEGKSTPKYGLIYNSSYVGQVPQEIKGQIARTLANKIALCSRCDIAGEEEEGEYGMRLKEYMNNRISELSSRNKNKTRSAPAGNKRRKY
ncbi:nucleolar protein 58 [Nematocida sp. AWRm78]|nr:nucleolar protein 58 [Nematocida sp. AWRm79]KAI5185845.1 nucleolar protein 58 [Nematocida sp. AWRm78]